MLEHGVQIPALLSCFRPSSGFVSGFRHSRSRFGLAVGACGLEFVRGMHSSVRVHSLSFSCFVLFCVARSLCFSLAVCFHVCHVLCEHVDYESPY